MRAFRLTDAAFAALAAGDPSAATLDELRRAQLSRHLLMLRTLGAPPAWHTGPDVRERLADPMTMLRTAATRRGEALAAAPVVAPSVFTFTHAGLTLRVCLEDTDPIRARLGLTPTGPLDAADRESWRRHLDEAWRILATRHPAAATLMAGILTVIVPVEPDPGAGGISATSADAFGAVAISPPTDPVALAVGLLHECRHSVLNAVRTLFDLVRPDAPRGYSPWRDDPRPPFGILHGAYAYQAVTRFWRDEVRQGHGGALAAFEFARWRAAVAGAADDLLGGGALTAAGHRFTSALRDEAVAQLDEPVDPRVARLAAGANLDHRVRWRLRNLRVDPADAERVADAWRRGAPPPAVPAPALAPPGRRALENNDRLNLVHSWLRNGLGSERKATIPPGSGVRPGDIAYLGEDPGAGAHAYLQDLLESPNLAAWGGLALTVPSPALRERPELVLAVSRLVPADPREIAAYLVG
ncbi:MAG: HEXXH motif-containing putative peptide modification protein [Actinoplanes sp.]